MGTPPKARMAVIRMARMAVIRNARMPVNPVTRIARAQMD
jgi:hypothetical protein